MIRRLGGPGMHGVGGMALADVGASCPSAAAAPWSLLYDGNDDETDCGNGASILGLNAATFTVDCYFQAPAFPGVVHLIMVSQGDAWADAVGETGWSLDFIPLNAGNALLRFNVAHLAATSFAEVAFAYTAGEWYYARGRQPAALNIEYASINAGVEAVSAAVNGNPTSLEHLWHGRLGGATHFHFPGRICYAHVWNNDQGALGAVPVTPFAVDANTAGRWIHSDGAGAVLTDTSGNGNNGAIAGAAWSAAVPAGWTI